MQELHVALDFAAPIKSLLPFQRSQPRRKGFRRITHHPDLVDWNDLQGLSYGTSGAPFSVAFYDKKKQVRDVHEGWAIMPPHAENDEYTTRLEFRIRLDKAGLIASPDTVFSDALLDLLGSFSLADLTGLDEETLLGGLIRIAWQKGIAPHTPSTRRTVRAGTPPHSDELLKRHFGPWLWQTLRNSNLRCKTIDTIAPIILKAVLDELTRRSSAFDVRAAVAAEVPKLQDQLRACLGPAQPKCEPDGCNAMSLVAAIAALEAAGTPTVPITA